MTPVRVPKLVVGGFVLLAAVQPLAALEVADGLVASWALAAGALVLAIGAFVAARARRSRLAWVAAGCFAVASAAALYLDVLDIAVGFYFPTRLVEVAWTALPLAVAAGVGALTWMRDREWLPIAALVAIGQLLVLPPPPFLEVRLARVYDLTSAHGGLVGLAIQLAVAAAAIVGAAIRPL